MLFRKYPYLVRGLARLQAREDRQRTAAMFPVAEEINGLPVLRLTPRHYDQLILCRSVFLITSKRRHEFKIDVTVLDIGKFLWIVSQLNPLNQPTWKRFLFRCLFLSFFQQKYFLRRIFRRQPRALSFELAIDQYYDRMFFDQPPSTGSGRVVGNAFSASVVNRIASAYGWPDEVLDIFNLPKPGKGIMDMALPRLFQYWRSIVADNDPNTPLFSRLRDDYKNHVITKWRGRAKKAGFGDDVEKYLIAIGKLPSPLPPSAFPLPTS